MAGRKVHSRCVQLPVGDLAKSAISIFSKETENGEIPLVLIPTHRGITDMWLSIPTGCHCLMQKWGKNVGKVNPGLSFKPPYYRIAYVVTQQSCTYNAPVSECPTKDNVRVAVDIVIVFAIRDPEAFVYKLGAVHFDQLLSGAVDEGIRVLVRSQPHETVWTLRGNRAESMLNQLNAKFTDCGVIFSGCTITSVILPPTLQKSMEHRTEMVKSMEKVKREHEYKIGEIKRESEMELEELKRKNEQIIVTENGKKKRAELEHDQQLVKAEEQRKVAVIEAEQKTQVELMESTAKKDRTKVDVERIRVEMISKAEADAEARRVASDVNFQNALVAAEAEKQRLIAQAKGLTLEAQAEGEAAKNLIHLRKHELEMREKEILRKLAEKANYNLIGDSGDKMIGAIMSGQMPGAGSGGGGGGPTSSNGWFR